MPLRVLHIHTAYRQRGGEDEAVQLEASCLRQLGAEVTQISLSNSLANIVGAHTSTRYWKKIEEEILRCRPQIAHVHNLHYIGANVISLLDKLEVPTVATLHNYRLFCVGSFLIRDQQKCDICLKANSMWPGIKYACSDGSTLKSALTYFVSTQIKIAIDHSRMVKELWVPSMYMKSILESAKAVHKPIFVKPNAVAPISKRPATKQRAALYAGRLSPEKGILDLLEVWAESKMDLPLYIVGDGPLRDEVTKAALANSYIVFLGPLPQRDLFDWMNRCSILLMPSRWEETFGLVLFEALAHGCIVVAASTGYMESLRREGLSILTYDPKHTAEFGTIIEQGLKHAVSGDNWVATQAYLSKLNPPNVAHLQLARYNALIAPTLALC